MYEGGWRSQKYTVRGEEEVKEGGKERMRRSQTWSQVQRFPSELWFVMKFQGERAESKPEVTERRAQANNLPSRLCLHPSILLSLHLYLVCGSATFTLLSLLRPPWVRAAHVCRRGGNVSVSERQRRCNQSKWNPKTQQEHEGDSLSPHHVETENTEGDTVLCFCGCLDFCN